VVYLVVQGEWKRGAEGELRVRHRGHWADVPWGRRVWMYSALEHWLATMEEQGGVRVARCRDTAESASWIKTRATWWAKEWEKHDGLNTFHTAPLPSLVRPGITRRMAKEIPGIHWEISDRVARHFGTPRVMANATTEEWMKIAGIGREKARLAEWLMANGKEPKANGRAR
jgi:ERCC4-type nuclease